MNPLLIISRRAPTDPHAPLQALHSALAAASIDVPVTLLWQDDGTQQLFLNADSALSKMLQQLELFDEIRLLCARPALEQRGLDADAIRLPVQLMDGDSIRQLIHQHHAVMVY
jgi:sulfur relay (sulfurtransferase) DsrF/TusC family protein